MANPLKKIRTKTGKRKMQNVNFTNVEEFLQFLPEEELKIVELLRKIIFDCLTDCTEKLSYNVPFYKVHSNICFVWPSSVTWGSVQGKGVRLGFTKGYLLPDEDNYLDKGNRKQVYWKDFLHLKDVDTDLLKRFILEAAYVDQSGRKKSI
jgi:hypothetical protein